MNFPELTEVEGKLTDRRKQLKTIFDEAGPDLDMSKVTVIDGDSAAKAAHIKGINDELTELGEKRDELLVIVKGAENAQRDEAAIEGGDDRPAPSSTKTFADHFIGSDAHKTKGVKVEFDEMELKTLMTTANGWAPETTRGPRLVEFATRPLELFDIVPTTTTGEVAVTYMEETTYTNNAAETAEGAAKPEAALALTEQSAPVRKIAVTLPVTDEQLEDVPRLRGYIDNRLPFMVRQRLSGQIAVGDGTGVNLRGILNVVGIQTQAKGADPAPDAVYKAMVKVMTTGQAMPDAYVTNPLDWQDIRLLRTTDGIYIWGSPSEAGPDRIWGLRTVLAQAMTQNTGVVGDFGNFSELAVKKGVTVDVGLVGDQFKENKQTLRAEMRAALVWYRPTAFCSVTGI